MKILVIRFSSIGDIVLTTPIVRGLKQQLNSVTLHFLTKTQYAEILLPNPNIDRVITFQSSLRRTIKELKAEKYDVIIDLHHNLRTFRIKSALRIKAFSFPKLNWEKWLLVRFKKDTLPDMHIVERYALAIRKLGVRLDNEGCDYFLAPSDHVDIEQSFQLKPQQFLAIAIGAQYKTKCLPLEKLVEIIKQVKLPVVLLGGKVDQSLAQIILSVLPEYNVQFACGKYTLAGSASIISQAAVLLTNDTGLMHIGSCFDVPIVSVWGNTVPKLGMYPYRPSHTESFSMHEVKGLSCRPCSKIGFQKCPKGHFHCMTLQSSEAIANDINKRKKIPTM
jgi:ADP-heptose:LPS heptosyltransferase